MIFGQKIARLSFAEEYIGVVIESRELAETQLALFENLWERLPNDRVTGTHS